MALTRLATRVYVSPKVKTSWTLNRIFMKFCDGEFYSVVSEAVKHQVKVQEKWTLYTKTYFLSASSYLFIVVTRISRKRC